MIHHLLSKPIRAIDPQRVEWECFCGLRVALPPQRVPSGTAIKIPDARGHDIIECAACYAGVDEQGEIPVPQGAAANERPLDPTFDSDLGAAQDDESVSTEDDGEILATEAEEFPE